MRQALTCSRALRSSGWATPWLPKQNVYHGVSLPPSQNWSPLFSSEMCEEGNLQPPFSVALNMRGVVNPDQYGARNPPELNQPCSLWTVGPASPNISSEDQMSIHCRACPESHLMSARTHSHTLSEQV